MEKRTYNVADHIFSISGDTLCAEISKIEGFRPFEVHGCMEDFNFQIGNSLPDNFSIQYSFSYEDILGEFGTAGNGFFLRQTPAGEEPLLMWTVWGENRVYFNGNISLRLLRFAVWIGFGIMTAPKGTVAIHSSCIVSEGRAVIFLGESGTGKSTHTRLWKENIPGAVLLNDDSPIVRSIDGTVWAYGSPWSGKTHCYKAERYPLAACVRLSQSPYNKMHKLNVIKGYVALHPSCPPEFAYDERIYSHISSTLGDMLKSVKCYWLECLPDSAAAQLSHKMIFNSDEQ